MDRLRNLLRNWSTPQGAVWLPVLPPAGAFAELVGLFGVIQLVNFVAPELDILNVDPNPYWLPILLLSLQYGTVAGLLAAATATLAYAMAGLPEQNIDEHHFAYLLRVWSLPILWIGVALVLGQFRLRQIELKQQLSAGLQRSLKEGKTLNSYVLELERRCQELERLITARGRSDDSGVLDVLASFSSPSSGDLSAFLKRIADAAFPRSQISVYALKATGLDFVCSTAGTEKPAMKRIDPDHALYGAIVTEKRSVSVLERDGETLLDKEGMVAVPVVHAETGRVLGMLRLDEAPAAILCKASSTRLAAVSGLIAPMMCEPRAVSDAPVNGPVKRTGDLRRIENRRDSDADLGNRRPGNRPRVKH